MTDLRKAAEMALKAMDKVTGYMHDADYVQLDQAIDALRAAHEREKVGYEVQEFFAVAKFDQRHLELGYVRVTIGDVEKLVNSICERGEIK